MLERPGMVTDLLGLIAESEPVDIKRTIKVFTNVYRHSLRLACEGQLDAFIYENSYPEVSSASRRLMEVLKTSVDEGITVQLVRYLESSAEAHMTCDLSKHPQIARLTAPAIQQIYDSLVEFVGTPYVSGYPFCLAIRAIFSIACYREDLRPAVVALATKLLDTPPPNFYEHNVRGYKKVLQRNFFRLLKLAKTDQDREKLVNLLTRVGIHRKRLTLWIPKVAKKRPLPTDLHAKRVPGRFSPPEKKKARLSPPRDYKESVPVAPTKSISEMISKLKALPKKAAPVNATEMLNKILAGASGANGKSSSDSNVGDCPLPPVARRRSSADEALPSVDPPRSPVAVRRSSNEERGPSTDASTACVVGKSELMHSRAVAAENTDTPRSPDADNRAPNVARRSPDVDRRSPNVDQLSSNADRRSPNADRRSPNADRRSPNADRGSPNADRRSPNAEGRSPNAEGRSPNTDRYSPNAHRRSPNADRRSPNADRPCPNAEPHSPGSSSSADEKTRTSKPVATAGMPFVERCSPEEKFLYDKFNLDFVVHMIMENLHNTPEGTPSYIPTLIMKELNFMREDLSLLMAMHLKDQDILGPGLRKVAVKTGDLKLSSSSGLNPNTAAQNPSVTAVTRDPRVKNDPNHQKTYARADASDSLNCNKLIQTGSISRDPRSGANKLVRPNGYVQSGNNPEMGTNRDPRVNSISNANRDPRSRPVLAVDANRRDPRIKDSISRCENNNVDPRTNSSMLKNLESIPLPPVLEEILASVKNASNIPVEPSRGAPPLLPLPKVTGAPSLAPASVAGRDPRKVARGVTVPVPLQDPRQRKDVSPWDVYQ